MRKRPIKLLNWKRDVWCSEKRSTDASFVASGSSGRKIASCGFLRSSSTMLQPPKDRLSDAAPPPRGSMTIADSIVPGIMSNGAGSSLGFWLMSASASDT